MKTFTVDETNIVKISSNSTTSMHHEHASATNKVHLLQLQQQSSTIQQASCYSSCTSREQQ
jgi:hypothetical protein